MEEKAPLTGSQAEIHREASYCSYDYLMGKCRADASDQMEKYMKISRTFITGEISI